MKKEFLIYKLHFTTPLHLGNERDDYADSLHTINSDTMYAALTAVLAKIGYGFGENFNGDLGFSISNLFPYYQKDSGDNKPVYFFPKAKKIDMLPDDLMPIHKDIKKIQYLDLDFFEKYLNGSNLTEYYKAKNDKDGYVNIKGSYLTAKNIEKDFITAQVFPRVKVVRSGEGDAEPFYMERLFFKDYSGFWFIADGKTELLDKAMHVLQHEGIGTDRNVGNGYFVYEKATITLDLPESDAVFNLSLFTPESKAQLQSMLDEKTAYTFLKRGGWVTTSPYNTIRKNRIYAFEPGSIFKSQKSDGLKILGKIADITPDYSIDHEIFRNLKSIFIPTAS
jgi:CRISPR-associated protein Csm4